ncbi:MAG: 4Fe-4S binding protein [Bacilli bacterium]|nr:4Fe-4S binding protein [Bacilli bacterium]
MNTVKITINNREYEVPSNYTILDACRAAQIDVPTLCFLKDINETGACRMCVVEVEGTRNLQASCVTPVRNGMVVKTNTTRVINSQKTTLELLLANHNIECLVCNRNGQCELQDLAERFQLKDIYFENYKKREPIYDDASVSIVRDTSKCVLCGRCVSVCKKQAGMSVLTFIDRGFETHVGPAFDEKMEYAGCIYCGQCINVCPVDALKEKPHIELVWEAINDPKKHVVFQTAPAVRAAIAEEFGKEIGTGATGKMVAAIKRLGVNKVFDTNFAADLTIMEEGFELIDRLQNGGKLPMFTSCSPGWIRIIEQYYPEFIPNLSTCKSPHQMFGAIIKSYYAKKMNIDPKDIFVVSVMPCSCKKSEMHRPEMAVNGNRDVDAVLTTREVAKMIKQAGIDFNNLPDEDFDHPLGEYSGAGVIFGATGGVMEAALRTVADVLSNQDLKEIDYNVVRGTEGIKEAELDIAGHKIRVAVAHGGANAKKLMDMIKSGEKEYHFVEIMGCNGGCVNGGGQPYVNAKTRNSGLDHRKLRAQVLYNEDKSKTVRKSHLNKDVMKLYDEFLGKPNSHLAHELLHTHYHQREIFPTQEN